MTWQDIAIGVSNIGFLIALLPLLLSLFGIKTIHIGLVATGLLYGSFLFLTAAGILGLGAYFGGLVTLAAGAMWFVIAAVAKFKSGARK